VTSTRADPHHLYVVDDDDDLLRALADYLGRYGFRVETASSGAELDGLMAGGLPDLVVLDVMMPGEDGLAICRRLAAFATPVLLLSALGETTDRIVGLELGASDYLPKPFEPRELLARIRSILRRPGRSPTATVALRAFCFDGWRFEADEHRLRRPDGQLVSLTPGEARLLAALTSRQGRLFSRDALIGHVRGHDAEVYDRSIDLLVSRLRRKLLDNGLSDAIETVRGEGYRFVRRGRAE